jgi:hypothetical protein
MEQDLQRISDEIADLRAKVGDLSKRLEECERKPEEILQAIEDIWREDPEVQNHE